MITPEINESYFIFQYADYAYIVMSLNKQEAEALVGLLGFWTKMFGMQLKSVQQRTEPEVGYSEGNVLQF